MSDSPMMLRNVHVGCPLLDGEPLATEAQFTELIARATTPADHAHVARRCAHHYLVLNRHREALDVCISCLSQLGIALPSPPTEDALRAEYDSLERALAGRTVGSLVELPMLTDPEPLAAMDVLLALIPAAELLGGRLRELAAVRMANLSIELGHGVPSAVAYAELSRALIDRSGPSKHAIAFGMLALELAERAEFESARGRVYHLVSDHVLPWIEHVSDARTMMRRAYELASDAGDVVLAFWSLARLVSLSFASGEPLDRTLALAQEALAFGQRHSVYVTVFYLRQMQRLIEELRREGTPDPPEPDLEELPVPPLRGWFCLRRLARRVVERDQAGALDSIAIAELKWVFERTAYERTEYRYYAALSQAAIGDVAAVSAHAAELALTVEACPINFASRATLLAAELARLEGRPLDAEPLYEAAIDAAIRSGFLHEEALANERAAEFYAARRLAHNARAFRGSARAAYLRWGALSKARTLEDGPPEVRAPSSPPLGKPSEGLDLTTVIEVSKAVSSELILGRLVERLIGIATEHAGATRGLLVLRTRDGDRTEAEAVTGEECLVVRAPRSPVSATDLPLTLFRHVLRTRQTVSLGDVSRPSRFAFDSYFAARRVRSILCLPLVKQTELIGVLYLENERSSHAFTEDRVAVLSMLASQAAISLENARLYDDLRRVEVHLAEAQALSNTGSFGWNTADNTISLSDEARKIYGFSRGARQTVDDVLRIVHPDDRDRITRLTLAVSSQDQDFASDFRIITSDGTLKHVHVVARVVAGELGVREYLGAIRDVTAEKLAEEQRLLAQKAAQLQLTNERLELALRTSKTLEEQLTLAKDLAEAANQAKDDFLANVSHEIRTPMNAILGMTELMLDEPLSKQQRSRLTIAQSAGENLLALIDDLLDFSKIEAGKFELEQADFSLRAAVDESVGTFAARAQQKGLVLHAEVDPDLPDHLVGDAGRVRQVLINLLGNAVKFTMKGKVLLRVDAAQSLPDRVALRFAVHDTGIGVPADKQALIFQAFTQQDTSTTRTYGGTGLGLTIAARLASAMSGGVTVESAAGRGSIFTFTASFGRPTESVLGHPLPRSGEPGASTESFHSPARLRMLVAEDNGFNSTLMLQLIERRGHHPIMVDRGDDVLARLAQGGVDLLLLDLHMPGLDGFQVIEQIRAREKISGEHLPVIAVTARARPLDRERCLASGMDDFISKPIKASALWSIVDRLLSAGAASQARALPTTPPAWLDASVLLGACDHDPQLLATICKSLEAKLPAGLAQVAEDLERSDALALRESAHELCGMIAVVSTLAYTQAVALEELAARGALHEATVTFASLNELTAEIVTGLSSLSIDGLEAMAASQMERAAAQ